MLLALGTGRVGWCTVGMVRGQPRWEEQGCGLGVSELISSGRQLL